MLIAADRIITPARVLAPGWLLVDGDRVTDVGAGDPPRPADVALPGATVVPGFVDVHAHGGGGASFDRGDPDAVATAVRTHLAHGTTSMVTSLVSADRATLLGSVQRLADLTEAGVVAGIHLEGPWLSGRRAGAHDPAVLGDPTAAEVDAVVEAARGYLRMVTLAPERPGGLDAVRRLGRLVVEVRDGVARLAGGDTIAGSTLTMAAALRYAVRHQVGLPLVDAVRAATAAPTAMLGLQGVGALEPGLRANAVVLDADLDVRRVLHRGRWVA